MCDTSSDGSPSRIHSAITLPMPPAPAMPCAQNPAATKKPGDLGLAETELVVGRERLRTVDHPADAGVGQHRHAALRVRRDLLEPRPVLGEQFAR